MAQVRESPAAAQTDPGTREVPGSPEHGRADHGAPLGGDAVDGLLRLTTDVLRTLQTTSPPPWQVDLPPALAPSGKATVDIDLAVQVKPQLRDLRTLFADYRDGVEPLTDSDHRPHEAAVALRDLLEIVLGQVLTLPGEEHRTEPATEQDIAQALRRADDAVGPALDPEAVRPWTLRNLTPGEQTFRGVRLPDQVIPGYGERKFPRDPRLDLDLDQDIARGRAEVGQDPPKPKPLQTEILALYVWVIPGAFVAGAVWGTWGWVLGAVALMLPATAVLVIAGKDRTESVRAFASGLPALLMQLIAFLVVLVFCLVVPAATIVYGADLKPVIEDIADGNGTTTEYLTLVCRSMQVVLIAIASLLPALLYYQFDRDRMSTLREKFVHQIFRLDPEMTTMGSITAKYGRLIDEIYGPERFGRYRKLPRGRRAPIFVATVLIMLGWLLVLLNPDVDLVSTEAQIADVFEPRTTAAAFAFLGAYFFTLFALLRGYVRRDLRPKSYSDISVRIVTVVILAWVLEVLLADDSKTLLVFAFLVGIVPQAALTLIREFWDARRHSARRPRAGEDPVDAALADPLPLTDLEGIDLYDRTRLASEGVTNIEGLAHHDLIELMLMTRIPVPRLVDWTDQAILYLHVGQRDRTRLRRYGIRTASDLLKAQESAEKSGKSLAVLDGDTKDDTPRVRVIVDSLRDEAWMGSILAWHRSIEREAATPVAT